MTTPELAYSQVEELIKRFKALPTAQRKGMNEMQTRLGFILPLFSALDRRVYALHGLSESEIRVLEGK